MKRTLSLLVVLFVFLTLFQLPVAGAAEELADGNYKLDFVIYKQGTDEPSVMYDYVDEDSGTLRVENNKKYVSFVLKQSAQITGFKTVKGDLCTGGYDRY
ncbi:NEAT domain-containing protein [Paenibacillus sp. RC67]|uniref:NEAT domain-containing protein n=1 Tax=Paenibacillus sp. RC67 TaxID=3039392 RepID=UPI0024ACA298|nr:NEAT domain-containing protein [Paenibacillus sp. RC67]